MSGPAPIATGIEALVCEDIARRQAYGVVKYGKTLAANRLPFSAWLQHAYEEALDFACYLKRAQVELQDGAGLDAPPLLAPADVVVVDGQGAGDYSRMLAEHKHLAARVKAWKPSDCVVEVAPTGTACPAGEAMGDKACTDRHHCLEACGALAQQQASMAGAPAPAAPGKFLGWMYVAKRPCGRMTAMAWDDPGSTAAAHADLWRSRGDNVERVIRHDGDPEPEWICQGSHCQCNRAEGGAA